MIDSFVVLTPILMLAVIALVRFVGCNAVFGVEPTTLKIDPPDNIEAKPADRRVDLTWYYPSGKATKFKIFYGEQSGGPYLPPLDAEPAPGTQHGLSVPSLINGTTYYFKVTAETSSGESLLDDSEEVASTPGVTEFVIKMPPPVLGTIRNNHTGWVGMAIQVGPNPLTITQLGRIVAPLNSQPHNIKIVAAANAADLGSVAVSMPAAPIYDFAYESLSPPVKLNAFGLYYIVSEETNGGDQWYHRDTSVETTDVADVLSGVYNYGSPPYILEGVAKQTYGPVDFRY